MMERGGISQPHGGADLWSAKPVFEPGCPRETDAATNGGMAASEGRSTHPRERGAALLIVFVFAAIVAIMLYREMPVTAFEARREKEQLLVDRGHEYVRAIQLYYRRFKPRYPPSLDALENTDRMRFLRHRFKDPFTGKDDWRLVHTNGLTLTDSKVNQLKTGTNGKNQNGNQTGNQNGNQNGGNSSSEWFTKSDSGFDSDSSSKQTSSSDQPEIVVPPVRARPPAIPAHGTTGSLSAEGNPEASPPDTDQNDGDLNAQLQASLQGEPNATGSNAQAASTQQGGAQQTGSQQSGAAGAANPMQMVRNMLSGESPLQPQQMSSTAGAAQGGGGIAGVASKAGGQTIKVINDQTDYSLWEFVYDPTKDKSGTQPVAGGTQQPQSGTGTSPFSTTNSPSSSTTGSFGMQPAEGTTGVSNSSAVPTVRTNPQ